MPYDDVSQLPAKVQQALPLPAQELYKFAFNEAWKLYYEPYQHKGHNDHATVAHTSACEAVRTLYEKGADGIWHKKAAD